MSLNSNGQVFSGEDIVNIMQAGPTLDTGLFAEEAEQSFTLPANWYYDADIYRIEHDAIFYRSWWYQCHVSDLSNSGMRKKASRRLSRNENLFLKADKPKRFSNFIGTRQRWNHRYNRLVLTLICRNHSQLMKMH